MTNAELWLRISQAFESPPIGPHKRLALVITDKMIYFKAAGLIKKTDKIITTISRNMITKGLESKRRDTIFKKCQKHLIERGLIKNG